MAKDKSFGIQMMTYGIGNTPLGVKEKWFSTARDLSDYYDKNKEKTTRRKRRGSNKKGK